MFPRDPAKGICDMSQIIGHHAGLIDTMVIVAATDAKAPQEQWRVYELLRDALGLERLYAGAIEWSARARHTTF